MERSSSLSLTASDWDTITGTYSNGMPERVRGSAKELVGGLSYYIPDTIIYLEADYIYRRLSTSGIDAGVSDNGWGAALGIAPIDGLLVLTRHWNGNDYRFNVETRYVTQLPGSKAIRLEAGFYDWEESNLVTIGGDYYFDQTWSLGGWLNTTADTGIRLNTGDNGFGIRTRKFFSNTVSVAGDFYKGGSLRRYGLMASFRF